MFKTTCGPVGVPLLSICVTLLSELYEYVYSELLSEALLARQAHDTLCGDPCRLVRQVKKIPWLGRATGSLSDPCHLAWQVNQILRHSSNAAI